MLLTDGINTDGPPLAEAAEYARRRGVPLFLIGLGSDQPVRDLKLSDLLVDDVVFVDDVVNFECKLTATRFEGRKVPVVLREKGKPAVLAKIDVTVGPRRPAAAGSPSVPAHRSRANSSYVVEVEPQNGKSQIENNRLDADGPGPQGKDPRAAGRGLSRASSSAISATCSHATKRSH